MLMLVLVSNVRVSEWVMFIVSVRSGVRMMMIIW